jgi:hypothetical protein
MYFDEGMLIKFIYLLQLRSKGNLGTSFYAVTVCREKGTVQINYVLLRSYRIINIYKMVRRVSIFVV